jgi:hypothetical protein
MHAHVQRLVSVVKMATVIEECISEEHSSIVRFLWEKLPTAKDYHKNNRFLFTVRSIYRGISVDKWGEKRGKGFADDEEFEMEMGKWLRHQSKDFYAAGFDELVKRWDKRINVCGGYVEKLIFVLQV